MANLITDRVAYFLKDYPPFNAMTESEREQVAVRITVKYYEAGEVVFREGEEQNGFCYVVNQGNVKLLKSDIKGNQQLIDQCDPGDVFGVRSIITGNPYSMTAECIEETLLYAFPTSYFEELFKSNPQFSGFFASGYAAGQVIAREDAEISIDATALSGPVFHSSDVVSCGDVSIREAAGQMKAHRVGSIVITDDNNHPLGIVTDTDLRNKVVSEGKSTEDSITSIMTSPVLTIANDLTLNEVIIEMIRSGVHHLIMTESGDNQSPVSGIVSDHDVMLAQQNHPASILKSIKRSNDPNEWKSLRNQAESLLQEYLNQGLDMQLISGLITKINDTIIDKAIKKALEKYPKAKEIDFCWLSLGSEGREEQLLRTDQDNAIIFADSDNTDADQEVLLQLAEEVNDMLITCGFEKCPADIMARNPKYCQPLPVWRKYFSEWIRTPDPKSIMKATIFFDFRVGYGDGVLVKELEDHLKHEIQEHEVFLNFLAQNALQNPPPLSFFKHFLVERTGEHKDEFDIKKRGMMPLSDAARLLVLDHRVTGIQNTLDRYKKLAELEPQNKDIFDAASRSYEIFMRHRAMNGLEHADSGRFITIKRLAKLDKQILKNAFLSIKELHDLIEVRFQQAYFN